MTRLSIATLGVLFAVVTTPVCAEALTEKQIEGVEKTIRGMECTVEDSDITSKGDGYKADDVICKDGNYDMTLDKDFKITDKKKED
ncbi:MAG: hypothetical protein MUO41_06010 [Methyloceanibacter sp.]|jgi:hypothetical protein|nr:hypothetical protein [Methyloceanibacter sp.]